jgi:hypothetical protein
MPIEYTHGIRQYIRFYFKNVALDLLVNQQNLASYTIL